MSNSLIELQMLLFSPTRHLCGRSHAYARVRVLFFLSVISRQPAHHLHDSCDDRSMEQSVADVIMNFDATARSSIIIIHAHLNKLSIFAARRSKIN